MGLDDAIVSVSGETLYWKSTLKRIVRRAGVSESAWVKCSDLPKFKIARALLDDLERVGDKGWTVQRRWVRELASLDGVEDRVPDPAAGREARQRLRRLALEERVLVDPEELNRQQRQQRAREEVALRTQREQEMEELKSEFLALHPEADRQKRGYRLEVLLRRLFALSDLDYSGSYKTDTDQVDGSFTLTFTYLLEARWRKYPAAEAELSGLANKVERRLDATRGLFLSMAGFRAEAVQLHRLAKDNRLILMDGEDLMYIFEGRLEFVEAVEEKVKAASTRGEPYLRLRDLL